MTQRIEWTRGYQDPHDPEFRIPYYTARIRNLTVRVEMDPVWQGDCLRPRCAGWVLLAGNIWMHFPAGKSDRGGRKALAEAKSFGARCRLNPEASR